ncbi:MAG: hypothetical protein AAB522_03225 [Patescibacteria group bacterium]
MLKMYFHPDFAVKMLQSGEFYENVVKEIRSEFPEVYIKANSRSIEIEIKNDSNYDNVIEAIEQRFDCKLDDPDAWVP